ncbi:MAG: diguanylate cyclase [Actinomycetota bacterium]|nr:diguanylate cyclase [Actinomycetota bacterium]
MLATQAQLEAAAMMDSLTGLPNRRQLMAELKRLSETPDPAEALLAMFDLDGFKNYNDIFGHAAGDVLLTRLGRQLDDATQPTGTVYRLGGDEFCVLAPAAGLDVDAFLDRLAGAMSAHGEGFSIGCSYGAVVLPTETPSTEEALRLADQRMYVRKTGRRPSAGRQVSDALLRALKERHPDLSLHLGGVAAWSEAVARHIGMADGDVARVRQAAELHDVGKVAIPDAILLKPGPLTHDEREFIRRHTIIGGRIVSAAPALAQVARLVRASHEWMDGTGYPDALAGDEIPVGARVVAVCDAFDAMVSRRPYRSGVMTEAEAMAELRRCAGTQFDPRVVDAFEAVMRARDAALATATV